MNENTPSYNRMALINIDHKKWAHFITQLAQKGLTQGGITNSIKVRAEAVVQ